MLRFNGLNQLAVAHPFTTGRRQAGDSAQKFFAGCFAGVSFRSRLFIGIMTLMVTYSAIVMSVGLLLMQPSLLRQALASGRIRSAQVVRHLSSLLASHQPASTIDQNQLNRALEDWLQLYEIRHCIIYSADLKPILEKGVIDFAGDAELQHRMADLPARTQEIDHVIRRDGVQQTFVTIRPVFAVAQVEDTHVAQAQVLTTQPASVVGFLRADYDLTFVREQRMKFYQLNLVIMALFLGAGLALALVWSRSLGRPLRQLITGAQRIGNGDLDHRIDLQGHNELVLLGKSFNRMAAHLQQREQQLQRSEALYRHLIQDAHDGIFVVDRDLKFIEVNEKFCEMIGSRREELLQSNLDEVLAKTSGAEEYLSDILSRRPFRGELAIQPRAELALVSSLYKGKLSAFIDTPVETANEPWGVINGMPVNKIDQHWTPPNMNEAALRNLLFARTIDLNAAPINDELYMGIARDVTEKKHYEVELHRAAELRELLLRTLNDGIAVLDRTGFLLISNRAVEEIFEMSQTELLQQRFLEFKKTWQIRTLADEALPLHRNPLYLALHEQKRSSDCRLKICRAEKEKYLSVNAAPLYDEREQLIGAIIALRDITTAVQSERSREILQQQMQQTAKLASLGELAAGVAHEINNPMTGVINYAQILYDRSPANQIDKSLLQGILKESDRITKIVHNLLTFARQQPLEQSWASLADIMEASLHLVRHRLRKDDITLSCELPKDLPPLQCRSQQIQQVFINLLSNAQHALNEKYSGPHENKRLKITAQSCERQGGEFVRIEFHDTGAGIAPENLAKIFDPFFTTKSQVQGTGLGLSISYGIIKEHHGEIWAESQAGVRTTFIIELPTVSKEKTAHGQA